MVTEIPGSLIDDIKPYSVILHQVNCLGKMGAGLALKIARKWPEMYQDYRKYCAWFQEDFKGKNHRYELLGTFHKYQIDNRTIICNAFGQEKISKDHQTTDYAAWDKIFKKLEMQTRLYNKNTGLNWSIHCPYKMGCGLGGGDWEVMLEMIMAYFRDSPVSFVIHKY